MSVIYGMLQSYEGGDVATDREKKLTGRVGAFIQETLNGPAAGRNSYEIWGGDVRPENVITLADLEDLVIQAGRGETREG